MKCQICRKTSATWAWQPLGPAENADCFVVPGHHTRGFPLFKVCDGCKASIQVGHKFSFTAKGIDYVGTIHHINAVSTEDSQVCP